MSLLYLCQDIGVRIWVGCIRVRIWVRGYELAVSRSGYGCEYMGLLNLGVDRGVRIRAGVV
jgi:hypothetical protein